MKSVTPCNEVSNSIDKSHEQYRVKLRPMGRLDTKAAAYHSKFMLIFYELGPYSNIP